MTKWHEDEDEDEHKDEDAQERRSKKEEGRQKNIWWRSQFIPNNQVIPNTQFILNTQFIPNTQFTPKIHFIPLSLIYYHFWKIGMQIDVFNILLNKRRGTIFYFYVWYGISNSGRSKVQIWCDWEIATLIKSAVEWFTSPRCLSVDSNIVEFYWWFNQISSKSFHLKPFWSVKHWSFEKKIRKCIEFLTDFFEKNWIP